MQVILTETVDKLGSQGDVVDVANGFARNFLIPKGLAVVAAAKNLRRLDHHKRTIGDKKKREMKEVETIVARLEEISCTIPAQAGEEDRLFGSVTSTDIAETLTAQGIEIDRRKIHIEEPIKALGVYTVEVKVAPEHTAHLKVWVVKNNE